VRTSVALLAVVAANLAVWPAAWYLATDPVSTMPIKQRRTAADLPATPQLGEVLDFSELSPVQAYSRPLFSKDRRPWQPPPPDPTEQVAAPVEQVAPVEIVEPPQAKLVGVSASGGTDLKALMQLSVAPEPEWYIVGDDLDGWTVRRISAQSVVVARGEQEVSFELYPETSAGQ
jgi:hypothetical protein